MTPRTSTHRRRHMRVAVLAAAATIGNDGKRYSKCCYRDIDGVKHCDNYVDGTFTNVREQHP